MTVREYIGARYVPVFADPIQWDGTLSYEPLTVVTDNGTSYVSRQSVPPGTAIDNESYWVRWADYNAQLEEYIRQVQTYSGAITALNEALPIADFDDDATVKDAIDALGALLPGSAFDSTNTVDARFDTIEADNWVTTTRITDANVTTAKIADGAVTTAKIADANVTTAKIADRAITPEKTAQPVMLIVGDSWCAFSEGFQNWGAVVSNNLTENNLDGYEVLSYAIGGTGWNYNKDGAGNFSDQLAYAKTQMTQSQIKRLKCIVVIGGVNDLNVANNKSVSVAKTNITNGMAAFRSAVNTHFPKIPVYAGINAPLWSYKQTDAMAKKMLRLESELITEKFPEYSFIPIKNFNWGMYAMGGYNGDGLHPNATGKNIIAEALICALKGSEYEVYLHNHLDNWTISSGITVAWTFTVRNSLLICNFSEVTTSTTGGHDVQVPNSGWGTIINFLMLLEHYNLGPLFNGNGAGHGFINLHCDASNIGYISFVTDTTSKVYGMPITIDLASSTVA